MKDINSEILKIADSALSPGIKQVIPKPFIFSIPDGINSISKIRLLWIVKLVVFSVIFLSAFTKTGWTQQSAGPLYPATCTDDGAIGPTNMDKPV